MSASDRSFSENLDLLIKLLRRLKDKSKFEGIPGIPQMFVTNFDQITAQLLQQFGEPIKQMIADMVEQLQEELDEDMLIPEEPESETPVITGQKRTIQDIDQMLKQPGLSEEEIDRLLDERKRLKSEP
jgi:hypothetical protein